MLVRVALFLGLILRAVAVAQGASFDCARASTTFEHAICDDPELSKLDETLTVAYATAIGGLSDAAKAEMRIGQRAWRDFVAAACADTALPGNRETEVERRACLGLWYGTQVWSLQKSKMDGGLRFYVTQRFKVLPDPTGSSWTKFATKSATSVRIDGTDETALAFNRVIEDVDGSYDIMFGDPTPRDDLAITGSPTYDNDSDLWVSRVTGGLITVTISDEAYLHGAVHEAFWVRYLHFLRGPNRAFAASDLFEGGEWKAKLPGLAFAQLGAKFDPDYLRVGSADEIAGIVVDPRFWDFSRDGLIIQFQPYEALPFSFGPVTVTIPWSDIEDDVRREGMDAVRF